MPLELREKVDHFYYIYVNKLCSYESINYYRKMTHDSKKMKYINFQLISNA